VARYFGDIAPGESFPPFDLTRSEMRRERRETFSSRVPLPRIYRLYHLPRMGDRDWIAADLLTTVLTSDKASRLERSLVYDKQIATDVAAYVLPTEATGMLMVQATVKEGVAVETVEGAIDDEIERLAVSKVSEDELTRAMNRSEVEFAHQIENYDSRADFMAMLATYFNDPERVLDWLEPYRATTVDDLRRVVQNYLVPENRVTSIFVPEGA